MEKRVYHFIYESNGERFMRSIVAESTACANIIFDRHCYKNHVSTVINIVDVEIYPLQRILTLQPFGAGKPVQAGKTNFWRCL